MKKGSSLRGHTVLVGETILHGRGVYRISAALFRHFHQDITLAAIARSVHDYQDLQRVLRERVFLSETAVAKVGTGTGFEIKKADIGGKPGGGNGGGAGGGAGRQNQPAAGGKHNSFNNYSYGATFGGGENRFSSPYGVDSGAGTGGKTNGASPLGKGGQYNSNFVPIGGGGGGGQKGGQGAGNGPKGGAQKGKGNDSVDQSLLAFFHSQVRKV